MEHKRTATNLYASTSQFIRTNCKNNAEFMKGYIEEWDLSEFEMKKFIKLIQTDGAYKDENTQSIDLICSRESLAKNAPKVKVNSNCDHDKPLTVSRRQIASFLNENIDLETISQTKIHDIVRIFGGIICECTKLSTRLNLQYVSSLKELDVSTTIQNNIGTPNITHCIDELAFGFVKWGDERAYISEGIKKQQTALEKGMCDLNLGVIQDGKMKKILANQEFDLQRRRICTKTHGERLFEYYRKVKRQLKAIAAKSTETDTIIAGKRRNDLYQKRMNTKRKGTTKLTERQRYERHKKSFTNRNENKAKKAGKPTKRKKKKEEKASDEGKKRRGKATILEKNQPRLFEFVSQRKRKLESLDDGNINTKKRKCNQDVMIVNEEKKKKSDKIEMDASDDDNETYDSNSDNDIDIQNYETNGI
eukprot:688219_1